MSKGGALVRLHDWRTARDHKAAVQRPKSHDAIATVHRAWDERRMRLRSLARGGQLAKVPPHRRARSGRK